MKVRKEIRRVNDIERQAWFTLGRVGGCGAQRYAGTVVYVYHHVGEKPSVIVRGSGDTYSAAQARNEAACLLAAADWIETNVRNVVRRPEPKKRAAKKGGR